MNEDEVKITCSNDVYKYSPDQIYDKFDDLQTREQKSQNNWNELKKWLEENKYAMSCKVLVAEEILNKMQELGWDNE